MEPTQKKRKDDSMIALLIFGGIILFALWKKKKRKAGAPEFSLDQGQYGAPGQEHFPDTGAPASGGPDLAMQSDFVNASMPTVLKTIPSGAGGAIDYVGPFKVDYIQPSGSSGGRATMMAGHGARINLGEIKIR